MNMSTVSLCRFECYDEDVEKMNHKKEKQSLKLNDVVHSLEVVDYVSVVESRWEQSLATLPNGILPFLEKKHIEWAVDVLKLSGDILSLLLETASYIQKNDALRAFAWHSKYCLPLTDDFNFRNWPLLLGVLDRKHAGMFYVLALLSGTREMLDVFEQRNIPDDIRCDTMACVENFIKGGRYSETHDCPGLAPADLEWLRYQWKGVTFHIGRLEFCVHKKFPGKLFAFKNRTTGQVIALASDGLRFRNDGQIDGANGIFEDPDKVWFSHLERSDTEIIGNPIVPDGHAAKENISLSLTVWKEVLSQESDILDIHIPFFPPAPMDFEESGHFLARAKQVLPECFPEKKFAAFFCSSWILDSRLQDVLSSNSNMLRFQREMYLYPRFYERSGLVSEAIFGKEANDLASVPQQTSLQRAAATFLKDGGRFNGGGGCFLLLEDFNWGSQCYQTDSYIPISK